LNRARLLLEENRLSITEISHQLGYSDASHFVREFSRQYGTTPGRFARALRN
jgi:AraC family transcriptional activator of pyochelin receptor